MSIGRPSIGSDGVRRGWLTCCGALPRVCLIIAPNGPNAAPRAIVRLGSNLENWPILEKTTLRQHASEFVADDCDPRKMFLDNTSGTTGTPLQIYLRRATVRAWYALHEARVRCWHGISRHDRWAILGGQMVTPASQQKPPFWVWNRGMNQLYLSTFHLTAANAAAYVEALRKYGFAI